VHYLAREARLDLVNRLVRGETRTNEKRTIESKHILQRPANVPLSNHHDYPGSEYCNTYHLVPSRDTSGTRSIAALNCTSGMTCTTDAGVKHQEYCQVDWPDGTSASGTDTVNDLNATTVYTFEACMRACSSWTENHSNNNTCQAVTCSANLTSSVALDGGNYILKPAQGVDAPRGDLIASAAIVNS
jgi:hypothetical protein